MRRLTLWSLLAAFLSIAFTIPALAQEDWVCFYDFTAGDQGWEAGYLFIDSTRDAEGWHDSLYSTSFRGVDISTTFNHAITVTRVEVDFSREAGLEGGYTGDAHTINGAIWLLDYQLDPPEPLILTGEWGIEDMYIRIYSGIYPTDPGGSVTIHSVTLAGTGTGPEPCDDEEPPETELTRPIEPQQGRLTFQSVNKPFGADVEILARKAVLFAAPKDEMVSAVTSGIVTLIEPFNANACSDLMTPITGGNLDALAAFPYCRVTIATQQDVPFIENPNPYISLFPQILDSVEPIYLVHIEGDDGREYLQIATHVDDYVTEGQPVSAGCWLGRIPIIPGESRKAGIIMGLINSVLATATELFGSEETPFEALTAVWVKDGEEFVNAWDEYSLEPTDVAPCNSPEGYEGCMSDTRLEDASQWESSNGVSWLFPGALLSPNSYIAAVFNLNAEREPAVLVGANAPSGNLAIQLGTAQELVNPISGMVTLELAAGDPDTGDFYTLLIRNTGNSPVRLDFVCVSHGRDPAGNPSQPPGELPPDRIPGDIDQTPATRICYFKDSSLENGLDEWDQTGDVEEAPGALRLPDDATITQNLELPAGTYTLTVITQVWALASYTPDEEDDTGGITLSYAYLGASFTSMGEKTWGDYAHLTQTYRATITIEDDETEDFTLMAELASVPMGVLGVSINSACLSTARLGQNPDQTGDGDGLITPSCGTIDVPAISATQPGTWATWIWANLNKFYRCELMIVVNDIYTAMIRFFRTATWSIRWSQAAMMRAANWMTNVFQWLNGHLSNIALGQTTTVVSGGETCGNLFCLLETLLDGAFDYLNNIIAVLQQLMDYLLDPDSPFWAIVADLINDSIDLIRDVINEAFALLREVLEFFMNLINSIVSFLLTLAELIIALILMIIGQITNLAGFARDLIASIVTAWNTAEPILIPGMPDCTTYSHFWCKGVWVLDNTIYAQTEMFTVAGPMEIIQTIMIGMGSIALLLWCVKTFKQAISDIGGAV